MTPEQPPHEIVIVRRRHGGDHDEPHGGVWKVAFADFMTAMMAFFLVLWIVNSTSKETRASVARYFNPVRLSDTTPARKGLQDAREEDFDAAVKLTEAGKKAPEPTQPAGGTGEKAGAGAGATPSVATSTTAPPVVTPQASQERETAPRSAASEIFRDPFEPLAPVSNAAVPNVTSDRLAKSGSKNEAQLGAAVAALAAKVQAAGGPGIDIRETSEGTLISLTDRADFGMFTVGSAEPNGALVRLVTELGAILKNTPRAIIVRGHTDARRYRKPGFDNWRLSSGRAQSACDMLLRGGVDERRIERVEGHADHLLRNASEPEAAENRRVEILLRKDPA